MSQYNLNTNEIGKMKGVKFAHINCRSSFKKISELEILFCDFDFLLCSETWLDSRYGNDLIHLNGKTCYRADRHYIDGTGYKKGGGVAIYVGNKWSSFVTIDCANTFSTPELEIVTVQIDKPGNKQMIISCIYRPPKAQHDRTVNALTSYLDRISMLGKEIWIGGDFNWDWNRCNHEQLQQIKNLLREYNLHQLINGITRPLSTHGTCIDWLITNCNIVSTSGVAHDLISDHLPVFAIKKKSRNKHIKTRVLSRSYKKFNKDRFNELLQNSSWDNFLEITDPNELWEIMSTNITAILSIMCPLRYKNVFVSKPEWLTDELLTLMKDRNHYVKLAKERGAVIYSKLSRFLRNKCNKLVNNAKGDFIRNKLNENKKDPKRFWYQINSLLSGGNTLTNCYQLLDPETGDLCQAGTESELIHTHYATVGSNILLNHQGTEPWDYDTIRVRNNNGIYFDEIDQFEVEQVIQNIEVGKSSGIENISSNVLKIAFTLLLPKLTYMFNCSIRIGKFPVAWAHGTITLIPKCGNSKLVGNWRPITLVPLPGKLMEHLIHTGLFEIILNANVLSDNQYGFIPGRSTAQAVYKLYKDLSIAINNGNLSALLYVDISKAFDSIHYGRLLNKLSMLGLNSIAIDWLDSYLTHTQTTMFNGKMSSSRGISSGVPQALFWALYYLRSILTTLMMLYNAVKYFYMRMTVYYIPAIEGKW